MFTLCSYFNLFLVAPPLDALVRWLLLRWLDASPLDAIVLLQFHLCQLASEGRIHFEGKSSFLFVGIEAQGTRHNFSLLDHDGCLREIHDNLLPVRLHAHVGPRTRVQLGLLVTFRELEIEPTDQGGEFLNAPTTFYQWHSETFEIPSGAVHLATSRHFQGQAFSYGKHVHAIEFHPEMTGEMVHRWSHSEIGSKKLTLPGAQSAQMQMAGYRKYSTASDEWLARYLDRLFGSPGA